MVTTNRTTFDQQLATLRDNVIRLSEQVEQAVSASLEALEKRDFELARRVNQNDAGINNLQRETLEMSYQLVALQQPNSSDMRLIMATISIATNLERMGDHAAGIARLTLRMEGKPVVALPAELSQMAAISKEMLADAMSSLTERDAKRSRSVIAVDDQVDVLNRQVYDTLLHLMIAEPETIEVRTYLLWVAHNLERIADRATNICESILYLLTGELTEHFDNMP